MNTKTGAASCVRCKLCNIHGPLDCSDCREAKSAARDARLEASRCSMCGLLPDFCPCDRHDLFTLTDDEATGYPTEAEWNTMQAEAEEAYRREVGPFTDPEPDRYPTLAERLAASMRDDR